MTNPIIQDLADAAGYFIEHALNQLPERVRLAVGDAHTKGGEIEVRVRAGDPASISLWLVTDAEATWIASI